MDDQELSSFQPEPHISEAEIILIGTFYVVLDLFDFLPVAGDITDLVAAPMGFYYWHKGLSGTSFLVSEGIEAIPGLQEIPFVRTISWAFTVYIDRHPKVASVLAPATALAGALEGDVEGGLASEAATGEVALEEAGAAGAAVEAGGAATGATAAEGVTAEGGEISENARPSEQTAEERIRRKVRDQYGNQRETDEDEEGGETEETEEEERAISEEKRYEELTTATAERNPVEVAEEEELENEIPITTQEKPLTPAQQKLADRPKFGLIQGGKAKEQKAEEERQLLTKLKAMQELRMDEDRKNKRQNKDDDQDSNYLDEKAA